MKKLFTLDDIMVAFVSAIAYGFTWFVSKNLGMSDVAALIICIVVGGVLSEALVRVVYSEAVQRNPRYRVAIFVSCILVFIVGHYVSVTMMGASMIDGLVMQVSWVIFFPIVVFLISTLIRLYRVVLIRKQYGDGSKGYTFDLKSEDLEEVNRQNQPIVGDFDEGLAVTTKTGTYVGDTYKKTMFFLGIPYAKPPVAGLRWKAPQELEATDAVFEAKSLGASAIQVEHEGSVLKHHRQSEDCLTLNVCIGKSRTKDKKPVLVLFHHGDFTNGGFADPLLYGSNFVSKHRDTVFVSFNYRLGIFGFIDFSEVPGGEGYPDTLNLGLLDQVAALRWVHENIAAFGGDPDNVTVVGFESGASCISLLAATKEAKGLFHKAFVFFGGPQSAYDTPDASRALAKRLLEETKTRTMEELMGLDTETLKSAAQGLWSNMCAPTCDGTWIPKDVYDAYRRRSALDIDFIFGIPSNEKEVFRSFIGERNYEEMILAAFEGMVAFVGEPLATAMRAYVDRKASEVGELEAKATIVEETYVMNTYRCASKLNEAGNEVHLMYWDKLPLIENMGSGTVNAVATLLSNTEALEMYGDVVDKTLSEVLQNLLVKFMNGADMRLYPNEIRGVDAFGWEEFPEAMVVSEGGLSCERIADRMTEVDGLLDFMVS